MKRHKLTLIPLLAATYFIVGGWPYGIEDIVSKAGYSGAILILLITPLVWSLPTALMVSELASALPEEGGFYVWARRAMGPFWGFQEAWLSLVASIFDMALYPTLFVAYLGHFAPGVTSGRRGIVIGAVLIAACAAWNLLGARVVGVSSVVMTIVLLGPFVVLVAYAFQHRAASGNGAAPPAHVDILGGILVAMWNYMGWDNASTIAGEVDRPQRTYPLAMLGAIALVVLSYEIPVAAVASTGLDPNRWTTGGWADVARAIFRQPIAGESLAVALTAGGMVAAAGTFNALTLTLSRLPAVMAGDGFLPAIFARRYARTGTPAIAIAACASAWVLCLGLSFVKLVVLDVLLTGLSILLEFASLVALRIREPELQRPYRVPGGLFGTIAIGVPPLALLVLAVIRNRTEPLGPISALSLGVALIVAGVAAYWAGARVRQRKVNESRAIE